MNSRIMFIANIDDTKPLPFYVQEFKDRGLDIKVCRISAMFPRRNIKVRIKRLLGIPLTNDVAKRKKHLQAQIIKAFEEYQPDIVCEINGMMLTSETAEYIRKKSFLYAMMIDRIGFFPDYYQEGFSKHYDAIYTYALDDHRKINAISHNSVYAPTKCDETLYFKMECSKDIDVSFVGRMYPGKDYGKRYDIFSQLIRDFPDLKLFVGGKCAPVRRPEKFLRWLLTPGHRQVFNNRNISQQECNEIYNRSKINISIERNGTGDSWSSRLVNQMGTESFILSFDEGAMTKSYFGDCLVFFKDYDDLKKKISYYLKHQEEREEIAHRAYKRVQQLKNEPFCISMTDDVIERAEKKLGGNK